MTEKFRSIFKNRGEEQACEGNYTEERTECDLCLDNIPCFIKTLEAASEHCLVRTLESGSESCADSTRYSPCSIAKRKRCNNILWLKQKTKQKECFGLPIMSEECCLCMQFNQCEEASIIVANLERSYKEAVSKLEEQLEELKAEESCLGNFNFLEICWKECELAIRCRRIKGIIPSKECIYFNTASDEENFDHANENCLTCMSSEYCQKLADEVKAEIIDLIKTTKIFKGFFRLDELRGAMVSEEEEEPDGTQETT